MFYLCPKNIIKRQISWLLKEEANHETPEQKKNSLRTMKIHHNISHNYSPIAIKGCRAGSFNGYLTKIQGVWDIF